MQASYRYTVCCLLSLGTASLSLLSPTPLSEIIYSTAGLSATSHYMARTLSHWKGGTGGSVPGNCDPAIITSDWLDWTYFPSVWTPSEWQLNIFIQLLSVCCFCCVNIWNDVSLVSSLVLAQRCETSCCEMYCSCVIYSLAIFRPSLFYVLVGIYFLFLLFLWFFPYWGRDLLMGCVLSDPASMYYVCVRQQRS